MSNTSLPRTTATGRHHQPRPVAPSVSSLGRGLVAVALTVGFLLVLSDVIARLG